MNLHETAAPTPDAPPSADAQATDRDRPLRIVVPVLARVEGEGALELRTCGGKIAELRLRIFEPPRFFEKLLEGRHGSEVLDIVARICGICPVAYQLTASQALENAMGVQVTSRIDRLRRLLYCGEWLQSHALHIHLLALPDFLGANSGIELARHYPREMRRGLYLQRLGNDLIRLLGGRSVHPVGLRIGGFHRPPDPARAQTLLAELQGARQEAADLVRWVAQLSFPHDRQVFTSVALRHAQEYPLCTGRIVSDNGLDLAVEDFAERFQEFQVDHSTALFAHLDGLPYLVGPLARLNLNQDRLSAASQVLLAETPIRFPSQNVFHSIVARAIEMHEVIQEAVRLLQGEQATGVDTTREPGQSQETPEQAPARRARAGAGTDADHREGGREGKRENGWEGGQMHPGGVSVTVTERAGVGYGATEAPRGLLWHRYAVNPDGRIATARIVPPTAQNQARIEEDLRNALETFGLQHSDIELQRCGEQVIRNYDPCISCATHFLRVQVQRDVASR
jgi:sulfhydrogenase subunit alpha